MLVGFVQIQGKGLSSKPGHPLQITAGYKSKGTPLNLSQSELHSV